MITNSKSDFFDQLRFELERVGIGLTDDIRIDFEEHFAECADEGVSEAEAAKRLGDVKAIARNYLNLESSRINSMVARDIERRVSLTKPGMDVPADLSLLNSDKDKEYEHIIEYTPEHFSEEIYPQAENSQRRSSFSYNSSVSSSAQGSNNSTNAAGYSQKNAGSENNVADAFSNAGRAVADAAKATGNAIAGAFSNSTVKQAVANAGRTTADAVRTAGHSATEAVKNAANNVRAKVGNVPHPSDKFREHINRDRRGTIPDNPNNIDSSYTKKSGMFFTDTRGLKPNVNWGRLIVEIFVLDLLVWSWVLPTLIGIAVGMFFGGFKYMSYFGINALSHSLAYRSYSSLVSFFLGVGHCAFGLIISLVGICLIKPSIKLFVHIINRHIKAIYDL